MKNILWIVLIAMIGFACENEGANKEGTVENTTETEVIEKSNTFGEEFTQKDPMSATSLLELMGEADTLSGIQMIGKVKEVCQAKGCWMSIEPEAEGIDPIFVTFKDYGFFMPKDIAGAEVLMEGFAYKSVTTVDELRHYAEDAGKSEEEIMAITAPKEEIKFEATGVVLKD